MSGRRVLVTGANGFIGAALCPALVARGWQVTAAVRRSAILPEDPPGLRVVAVGDVDGATNWTDAAQDNRVVVHLAGRVHVLNDEAADPLAAFRRVNTDGTRALARQAAAAGIRRFVFLSSIGVHGFETHTVPFTERSPLAPHSPYAVAKCEAELALAEVARETGLEVAIIRPPLVYGVGAPGNLGRLLRAIARGLPLPFGSIRNARTFVQRAALVDLIVCCMEHPRAVGQTFVAGDSAEISTPELIRRVAEGMGRRPRLVPVPDTIMRAVTAVAGRGAAWRQLSGSLRVDASRARLELGWNPCHDVHAAWRQVGRDLARKVE